MKKVNQPTPRIKAAVVLMGLLVTVLFTNFSDRHNYSDLDKSISSIYKDRLIPATYLFEITDRLYQKQLMQGQGLVVQEQHNIAVQKTIKAYDATYLTKKEREEWNGFKNQWNSLVLLEEKGGVQDRSAHFEQMHNSLQALTKIQQQEGRNLHASSKSIISFSTIVSTLQISLLLLLGFFCVMLIGSKENHTLLPPSRIWMN